MNNSQKIDAYFNDELSGSEKEQFLADLESNPELQKEFSLQSDIVEGIKEYRKAQLISRLNDIKIVSSSQYMAIKVLSSAAVVALVGLGAYFIYFTNSSETELLNDNKTTELVTEDPNQQMNQEPQQTNTVDIEKSQPEKSTSTESGDQATASMADVSNEPDEVTNEEISDPEVTMPEVLDEFESEMTISGTEEDISAPPSTIKSNLNLRTKLEVDVKMKRKYNFHYQVIDEKLTLFGEFEDGPFEILEINTNEVVNLYLYYLDNFYAIDQSSEDIKPLKEITDEGLIDRLQKLR